jgi:hypothetical protein
VSVPTPTAPGWGFFMRAASRAVWNSLPSLPVGEEEERGKQAVVPPAALPPSILREKVLTQVGALCKQRPPWNKTLDPFFGSVV